MERAATGHYVAESGGAARCTHLPRRAVPVQCTGQDRPLERRAEAGEFLHRSGRCGIARHRDRDRAGDAGVYRRRLARSACRAGACRLLRRHRGAIPPILEVRRFLDTGRQQGAPAFLGLPEELRPGRWFVAGRDHRRFRCNVEGGMTRDAAPILTYWHLWTDANGVSHQTRCALDRFEQGSVGAAAPQWNDPQAKGLATVVLVVLAVGWVGGWHKNPAPQWILPVSGRWWVC